MGGLLEVASVSNPEGSWASGYQIDSAGCALKSYVSDICEPTRDILTGSEDGVPEGLDANVFAVVTSLSGQVRCSPGTEPDIVKAAMEAETEKAAGKALWGLTGNTEVSLESVAVGHVSPGANSNASLSAALKEFWSRATGVGYSDTIIHLGVQRLLELFGVIDEALLNNLGIRVATSPGYPADGIAVTGPIHIRLSDIETLTEVNPRINKGLSEANRLAALEFDPCIAVRVQ